MPDLRRRADHRADRERVTVEDRFAGGAFKRHHRLQRHFLIALLQRRDRAFVTRLDQVCTKVESADEQNWNARMASTLLLTIRSGPSGSGFTKQFPSWWYWSNTLHAPTGGAIRLECSADTVAKPTAFTGTGSEVSSLSGVSVRHSQLQGSQQTPNGKSNPRKTASAIQCGQFSEDMVAVWFIPDRTFFP